MGLGLMIGPVLGSLIYSSLGYRDTFFVFGGILIVGLVLCIILIPNNVNFKKNNLDEDNQEDGKKQKEITFKLFYTNTRVMIAFFSSILSMILMLFFDSILTLRLEDLGVPDSDCGYIFAVAPTGYAIFAVITGFLAK